MIIYCDGGSRGNPGPSASAYVVTDDEKLIHKEGKFLGINTNNYAEYQAVLMAINWISNESMFKDYKKEIIFNLDSQLVERQLNGFYKVKNETLKILHDDIKTKLQKLKLNISFKWNFRSNNTLADSLVNEELDKFQSK